MKIGIITFHNGSNYGAALQTFALQEFLSFIYNDVIIINYDNYFISKGLRPIRWGKTLFDLYCAITDLFNLKNNKKKISNFKLFFDKYYNLSPLLTKEQLQKVGADVEICVSGSDQIWNPNLRGAIDDIYLGKIKGVTKRISYASSFGNYNFDNEEANHILYENLQMFSGITVREKADVLKEKLGFEAKNVMDPTLLLSKEDWSRSLNIIKKDTGIHYLLIYAMTEVNKVINYAKKIAKKRGLKPIVIGNYSRRINGVIYICDAGPKEFVELFLNADYIVTNSFHGTAFSINFEKQFISVMNPKSPERVKRLLDSLGMESRLVCIDAIDNLPDISDETFTRSKKYLMKNREFAYTYLKGL